MPIQTGQSLQRFLSDGSPDGTTVFQSSTDLGSFWGGTPVVQPAGNAQVAVTRGLQGGIIATYGTLQTPISSGVTADTTSESIFTVQTGTGGTMLAATGDLVFINKPTSQAGLGVGNVRAASSSNTIGVTFSNWTNATITPTSSETYSAVLLRGLGVYKLSATLSPAAVGISSTIEQQFTVTGLPVGSLVQVNKPTQQAGLDIVGCRVVGNNLLGITFANVTSASITPTSSEAYLVTALPGLDAVNNDVLYGMNMGTVGSMTTGLVVSGGLSSLTGVLATDMLTGIYKPTAQAAASSGLPFGILSANQLSLYYLSQATWTPTASEVYGIRTARLSPAAPLLLYTQTLTPVSVAANTTAEQTFTVTGLIASTPVWVNKPSFTPGLGIVGVRVSATNTLAINYGNVTSAAIVPPAEIYTIGNFQTPSPGAGNCVFQSVSPVINNLGNLANAMRGAMTTTSFAAGA